MINALHLKHVQKHAHQVQLSLKTGNGVFHLKENSHTNNSLEKISQQPTCGGPTMKSICAWCKKDLDNHQPPSGDETPISHGLCPECAFHIRASGGMLLQSFLDGLKAPIVLVDGDGVVVTANGEARAMLGKTSIQINGFRGGEVFECEYAYLPE